MSILLPPRSFRGILEPLWLPATEHPPGLPVDELHVWRIRLDQPRWTENAGHAERLETALFRRDVLGRYAGSVSAGVLTGPASGLRVAMAQCDHLALIAVSRNVRGVGLDIERVREDIPFEEMAGGFLDPRSQWDLRITRSPEEKAWKFFQFWTSNEACAQARSSSQTSCQVIGFSPEPDFIAALAFEGGPEAQVIYWDWNGTGPLR